MDESIDKLQQEIDCLPGIIDILSDRLDGLRTECRTTELTQQEIRTLETKLVKMFSRLLVAKAGLAKQYPRRSISSGAELKQWLKSIDLSESSMSAVWQNVSTLEQLLDKSNNDLRQLIQSNGTVRESEIVRWLRAMFNLKRCHHVFSSGSTNEPNDLSWTFWNGSPAEMSPRLEPDVTHKPQMPFKRGPLIAHRFTKKFRALSSTCNYCNKQMFFGLKCIECKYSCHNDCEASVPPSCGVPADVMAEFKQTFSQDGSLQLPQPSPEIVEAGNGFFFSRTSSRKTSTVEPNGPSGQRRESQTISVLKNYFEELSSTLDLRKDSVRGSETKPPNSLKQFVNSTSASSGPLQSAETLSLNGSIASSNELTEFDATDDRQSEWGIQRKDIKFGERIGEGRFGTVYRGKWYGDVAVKVLNANYLDDTQSLEAFKTEVATFKNTRHDNIVLFLGFCASPQAIVTTLCKGQTLYTHIHLLRDKFNLLRATLFAQQISNGMGYLHAKGIVHKDLTTKNIFVENTRVIITDFGLFSAAKMQYNANGFHIPNNWLCYLAPELIRGLKQTHAQDELRPQAQDELRFSKASDVYAFGTVWYEILSGEFPFKGQDSHSIMYQIGCGKKQTLANLQATREVKDILMLSWTFQAEDRLEFGTLFQRLKDLPNKQMPRNPKRPMHLSLSAEAVF